MKGSIMFMQSYAHFNAPIMASNLHLIGLIEFSLHFRYLKWISFALAYAFALIFPTFIQLFGILRGVRKDQISA